MAEKMKSSKCRQRGGRKDQKGINARRKAGLPAKAGRRKVYTTGKRKVKSFPDGRGRFHMKGQKNPTSGLMFNPKWIKGEPEMVKSTGEHLRIVEHLEEVA